jgi:putative membrane protein
MLAAPLVRYAFALDWTIVIGMVALAFGVGVFVAGRRCKPHPPRQVAAFYASLAILLVSFVTPIDAYDNVSFFDHMAQHLLLAFVAAPLFAFGAPVSLAMRASPERFRSRCMEPLIASRAVAVATHPAVAATTFAAVQVAILVRPLFDGAVNTGVPHFMQHAVLLASSFLFWRSMAELDPPLHRLQSFVRPALTVLVVGVVSVLGIVLLRAHAPLYRYATFPQPWGGRAALLSQRRGAWLMLAGGDTLVLLAALGVGLLAPRDRAAEPRG